MWLLFGHVWKNWVTFYSNIGHTGITSLVANLGLKGALEGRSWSSGIEVMSLNANTGYKLVNSVTTTTQTACLTS